MLAKLVSHNNDLKELVDNGYALAFDNNYLIVRDVPYLDGTLALQWGSIVTKLEFIDQEKVKQDNHQVFFTGSSPYGLQGTPVSNLNDNPTTLALPNSPDIKVQRIFSNKPVNRSYNDFSEKIESYITQISGPAIQKYDVTPKTFKTQFGGEQSSVFKFHDTLTSRAEISDLSLKFKEEVVAIIGLGGTGAYVLDFLVKTPVKEIRTFDGDFYHIHNAYRSPGKLDESDLGKTKSEVYNLRYKDFRNGLISNSKLIDSSCADDFQGVTFAFVCVDKGSARNEILKLLNDLKIPFIDVGMGLNRNSGAINGLMRTTYVGPGELESSVKKNAIPLVDGHDHEYKTNIQISELNALNACLAVMKYKQLRGFYHNELPAHFILEVSDGKLLSDEEGTNEIQD